MYSFEIPKGKEGDYARARVEDIDASYKDLTQVCGNIRRKSAVDAITLLEKAAKMEVPIRYRSHNTRLGHRRELGGRKGRYPVKSVRIVLKVLKSAVANAAAKGFSEELVVVHASANRRHSYPRLASKGRRNWQDFATARVEIVLREKEEAKKKRAEEAKKPAKKAAKPAEAPKPEEKKAPKPEAMPPEVKAEPEKHSVRSNISGPQTVKKAEVPKPGAKEPEAEKKEVKPEEKKEEKPAEKTAEKEEEEEIKKIEARPQEKRVRKPRKEEPKKREAPKKM